MCLMVSIIFGKSVYTEFCLRQPHGCPLLKIVTKFRFAAVVFFIVYEFWFIVKCHMSDKIKPPLQADLRWIIEWMGSWRELIYFAFMQRGWIIIKKCNYSAITARISYCAAYIAAYTAKSSLMAKRHMPDKSKTPLQASLLRIFALINRIAE